MWNDTIETLIITTIQQYLYGPPLRTYIRHKLGWSTAQLDAVNWDAFQRVMMSYPLQARTTRMKAIYGWLHTHQWKARIYSTTPLCPLCNELDTNDHVFICSATVENRKDAVTTFLSTIDEGTPLDVKDLFRRRLYTTLAVNQPNERPVEEDHPTIQDELGWLNFIRGRHTRQFEEIYDQYLDELPSKSKKGLPYKSGKAWATALVKASITLLV